ncbi:hypothetical protein [Alicyclobacillus sp.]|uniref:hypothetical protein n=1 Tax=Alicyclobacillus sp. TaxID=61169 RepID=UPI0025BE31EA|nr:hypothetical protein [Alicyclobacillus sp.]
MSEKSPVMAKISELDIDELWSRIHGKGEYLLLLSLLFEGREETNEKVREIIRRLQSIQTPSPTQLEMTSSDITPHEDLETRLNTLQQELDKVQNELKKVKRDAKAKMEKMERVLEEVRKERNDYRQKVREQEQYIRKLQQERTNLDTRIHELEVQVDTARAREHDLVGKMEGKDATIERLTTELNEMMETVENLRRAQDVLGRGQAEAAPDRASDKYVAPGKRIAVLGPPRTIVSSSPHIAVYTYLSEQVQDFIDGMEPEEWDCVCVLKSSVHRRGILALRERDRRGVVREFESISEVRDFLTSLE